MRLVVQRVSRAAVRIEGEVVGENPWQATAIEWSAPSPPPHGNFIEAPQAYRGPYEYSVPGAAKDFVPQFEAQ